MRALFSFFFLLLITSCSSQVVRKISSNDYPAESLCEEKILYGKSELQRCTLKTNSTEKKFFLFKGVGSPSEIQYAHGYLLAEEINHGSIEEMLGYFAREEANLGHTKWIFNALKDCHMKRLKRSVSYEFMQNISALTKGYEDGMKAKGLEPLYGEEDFIFTLLGIEVGNVLGGISQEQSTSPVRALKKVLSECGVRVAGAGLSRFIKRFEKEPAHDRKMGCVGVVAPDSYTGDGLIHGRNLDQTPLMKSWAKSPVIYLIHEEGRIPYVAAGTAGLIYPGGISGFNQNGIAVSLHQMNTTRWDTKHKKGSAEVVPYLQQRILREAKSIDEAFKLIQKTNIFSSWTILISDSKNQEVASIEISPNKKIIARRRKNQGMGQSNHYVSPNMQREHFHGNFAAYLETQSRLYQMEKLLENSKGRIDVDWTMNALSSHIDYFEGEKSFGRGAVKLSNIMTSIAYPARKEFWMTLGDKKPAAHSWYVGTKVDFEKMNLDVVSLNKSFAYEGKRSLEDSYSHAVASYLAYKNHENKKAIEELKLAIKLAQENGSEDTSYRYNIARLYMLEGQFTEASGYMENLFSRKHEFHPYHQALIAMYSARLKQILKKGERNEIDALYAEADSVLKKIITESKNNNESILPDFKTTGFEEARFYHGVPDLRKKRNLIADWKADKEAPFPKLDFAVND